MIIRPLQASDADAYRALRLFALEESPASFGASREEISVVASEEIERQLEEASKEGGILGAFEDRELIGLACLSRCEGLKERHKAWIWGVFVQPERRRQGVGSALLGQLLQKAAVMEGLLLVKLTLEASNRPARALYHQFGFERFGTEPLALNINGNLYDEDYMFLWLGKEPAKNGRAV